MTGVLAKSEAERPECGKGWEHDDMSKRFRGPHFKGLKARNNSTLVWAIKQISIHLKERNYIADVLWPPNMKLGLNISKLSVKYPNICKIENILEHNL